MTLSLVAIEENSTSETTEVLQKPPMLMVIGAPGSGQGVSAVKLAKSFSLPHISPATLLVEYVSQPTELGYKARDFLDSRRRIPEDFILEMLADRIKQEDTNRGFVLDGIPNTIAQIAPLRKLMGDRFRLLAISICIPDELLIAREEGRLVCLSCGRVYHKLHSPPEEPMTCDNCLCALTQRDDDTEESITKRLQEWHAETDPIIAFFKKENLLVEVNGNCSFDSTLSEIKQTYLDFTTCN